MKFIRPVKDLDTWLIYLTDIVQTKYTTFFTIVVSYGEKLEMLRTHLDFSMTSKWSHSILFGILLTGNPILNEATRAVLGESRLWAIFARGAAFHAPVLSAHQALSWNLEPGALSFFVDSLDEGGHH